MGIVTHQPLSQAQQAPLGGLYDAAHEHDACGVGMVVNIHGNKSHELVDNALKVLENMRHRGAEGAAQAMVRASCSKFLTSLFCYKAYLCPRRVNMALALSFCLKTPSASNTSSAL